MRIPKRYGQGRIDRCPFCGKQATAENRQGVPVCREHKTSMLNEMKCVCGESLLMMKGKYGIFFNCPDCGNMGLSRVMEFNEIRDMNEEQREMPPKTGDGKKEFTVRSDDPDFFD